MWISYVFTYWSTSYLESIIALSVVLQEHNKDFFLKTTVLLRLCAEASQNTGKSICEYDHYKFLVFRLLFSLVGSSGLPVNIY